MNKGDIALRGNLYCCTSSNHDEIKHLDSIVIGSLASKCWHRRIRRGCFSTVFCMNDIMYYYCTVRHLVQLESNYSRLDYCIVQVSTGLHNLTYSAPIIVPQQYSLPLLKPCVCVVFIRKSSSILFPSDTAQCWSSNELFSALFLFPTITPLLTPSFINESAPFLHLFADSHVFDSIHYSTVQYRAGYGGSVFLAHSTVIVRFICYSNPKHYGQSVSNYVGI